MRTMPMIWTNGKKKPVALGWCPCCVCGRDLNNKRKWGIHIIDGGSLVVHPDDDRLTDPNDPGEMGIHFVGPECRKLFGEFAFKWTGGIV